jgi:hypothetical protein
MLVESTLNVSRIVNESTGSHLVMSLILTDAFSFGILLWLRKGNFTLASH